MVLQHTHTFQSKTKTLLQPTDLLELPLQLCAHHSTTKSQSAENHYTSRNKITQNGPLLTHAIIAAFPQTQRSLPSKVNDFRTPTPLEQEQMDKANAGEDVIYKCRGCPTKYHVLRQDNGTLSINTWHYFGRDLYHASRYWVWFVRREYKNLGPKKRNSEFWYQSQTIPDFAIE